MRQNRFENIDVKLSKLSEELNGELVIDRHNYPESLRTFEERRIDWLDKEEIQKSIIINPTFELKGVNSELWNFVLVGWKWIDKKRYSYRKQLVIREEFSEIEKIIDTLLNEGVSILTKISIKDLE